MIREEFFRVDGVDIAATMKRDLQFLVSIFKFYLVKISERYKRWREDLHNSPSALGDFLPLNGADGLG